MDIEKLPFYLFFVMRPDGNAAFVRIHEQFPLDLDIDKLLGMGSNLHSLNIIQASTVHPDIRSNSKDEIDIAKNSSFKSINCSTFQMRCFDTVSDYRFIISASVLSDQRKLDAKLEQIYKIFVDYVIKSPFFNVAYLSFRAHKRLKIQPSSKNAMKFCTLCDNSSL
jgi:hypothetical protein